MFIKLHEPAYAAKWDSTSQADVEFAKAIAKKGDWYNCNPRGWFSGYDSDTSFAFYGPIIVVFNLVYKDDSYTKADIKPVHHVLMITSRRRNSMLGEVLFPATGKTSGSMTLESNGLGNVQLAVTLQGKSITTDFSCEFEIDTEFKN